jgi:hypothetical protein
LRLPAERSAQGAVRPQGPGHPGRPLPLPEQSPYQPLGCRPQGFGLAPGLQAPGQARRVPEPDGHLYQATRTQLDFLVRVHELERIVLITHYGCAFYRELLREPAEGCLSVQMDDLRAVKNTLHGWFPEVRVEVYLAMQRGRCLSFHQLDS